jgi:hypothetical protein
MKRGLLISAQTIVQAAEPILPEEEFHQSASTAG